MSTTSELAHLFRALKAPAAARALPKLAERARAEEWTYERFAQALLETEHHSREAHGGDGRIKAARFPARKTLEEFDFSFQRSVKKTLISTSGSLTSSPARRTSSCSGRPEPGKHTSRSRWASAPAWPVIASRFAPRPNGSRCSPTPNAPGAWTTSSRACSAIRC
jgi:hypothetical protein